MKNHVQIGLTVCGGFNNETSFGHNCSRLNTDDGIFEGIDDLVLSRDFGDFNTSALSFDSADGFVICEEDSCDLVESNDTFVEDWIVLYPQPM